MPIPGPLSETLNRYSVIIVTGGSSGIGCSIIKAIIKLMPEARVCNLSRSKPEVFLGENGVHLSTDLTDSQALRDSVGQLVTIIESAPREKSCWSTTVDLATTA